MVTPAAQFSPEHFLNRELSWLEFNQRVLDEALHPNTPLLERVKFFCIASSNLDEFFEVRVAGLKQQIESDVVERSVDGLTASETFRAVTRRVRQMVDQQYRCWKEELVPPSHRNGFAFSTSGRSTARCSLARRPITGRRWAGANPAGDRSSPSFPSVAQQIAQHDRPARDDPRQTDPAPSRRGPGAARLAPPGASCHGRIRDRTTCSWAD
jgi:hypothetical protein